jgi:hypothetical protein
LGEATSVETRHHVSSLDGTEAKESARAILAHWGIENQLHWELDVIFCEDDSRVRRRNGGQNFSILRRIALDLLKSAGGPKGRNARIRVRRKDCGWNPNRLLQILSGGHAQTAERFVVHVPRCTRARHSHDPWNSIERPGARLSALPNFPRGRERLADCRGPGRNWAAQGLRRHTAATAAQSRAGLRRAIPSPTSVRFSKG